ncbi:MAG: hypothetical protein ACP5NF_10995 [Thermoanaerobaculum sp.]
MRRMVGATVVCWMVLGGSLWGQSGPEPAAPCPDCCPNPPCEPPPPEYPQRLAFYYPWWDGTAPGLQPGGPCPRGNRADSRGYCPKWSEMVNFWYQPDFDVNGRFDPAVDLYNDNDPQVVATQLARAAYANIDGLIVSWWGSGSPEHGKLLNSVLPAVRGQSRVAVTMYYESKGRSDENSVTDGINSFIALYQSDPTRIVTTGNGRPVLFVYRPWYDGRDGCLFFQHWNQALATAQARLGIRPFLIVDFGQSAFDNCRSNHSASDYGWHTYDPGEGSYYTERSAYGFRHTQTLRPGFARHCWPQESHGPRECRYPGTEYGTARNDGAFVNAVVSANNWWRRPRYFQLITSWNEWLEFSSVEPAKQWVGENKGPYGRYLQILSWYPLP